MSLRDLPPKALFSTAAWWGPAAVVAAVVVLREWRVRRSLSGRVVLRGKEEEEEEEEREDVMYVTADDVASAVECLRATVRRPPSYARRVAALTALLRFIEGEEEAIKAALSQDLNRPEFEALAYDVYNVRHEIKHLLTSLSRLAAWRRVPADRSLVTFPDAGAYLVPEPYGISLIIGAWNYPFNLALVPVAGALAAGNAVVLKLPGRSEFSSRLMAEKLPTYFNETSKTSSLLKITGPPLTASKWTFEADLEASKAALACKFDRIFFTGSPSVGKIVAQAAAKHLTPCVLELGGSNPVFVAADADLALCAKRLVWARMLNAGQQCIAPDYVLCEGEETSRKLATEMARAVTIAFGDDPKRSKDFGRIVSNDQCQRLQGLLADVHTKASVVCGGEVDLDRKYVAPTIVLLKPEDTKSSLLQSETFGPILPILPVSGLDEAVAYVVDRPKPLSLYVFTRSSRTAKDFSLRTSAGGVCVNDCIFQAAHPHLPFGGVGDSGYGAYHGDATFYAFSRDKPLLFKSATGILGRYANFFVYPPWTPLKLKLLDLFMVPTKLFFGKS